MTRVARRGVSSTALMLTLAALGACWLVACSNPPANGGGPRSATISPLGGTLEASAEDGTRYTLTFPAGAVDRPTHVTLTPLGGTAAASGGFQLEPADLVLNAAASLQMELPAGLTAPATATFALGPTTDPTFVATTVEDGRLRASLRYFSIPDDASGVHTASASAATRLAVGPAPLQTASWTRGSGFVPQQGDTAAVAALEADCGRRLAAMRAAFDQLVASDSFEAAMRVVNNAGALAMLCGADAQVEAWQAEVVGVVCARYEELVLGADVIAADTYDRFSELIQPMMNWWGTMQILDVECVGAKDPLQVIGEKYTQFIDFYAAKVAGLGFTADYDRLLAEARKVSSLRGKASLLALPAAEALLEQQVLFPIMDLLRDRSFDECVAEADHYYLYSLLFEPFLSQRVPIGSLAVAIEPAEEKPSVIANFSDADLQTDIQYCASRFTFEVWNDPEVPQELVDQRRELGPGSAPGQQTSEALAAGPVEGHLVLRGPIEQLLCGKERTLEAHELVVRFAGTEAFRGSSLAANPEIDVEASLEAAGLDPSGLNDIDITLLRETEKSCNGQYGSTKYELFTVTYTADPAPRATGASVSPASMTAEEDTAFTFQLPWSDPGKNLKTLHVGYDLAGSVRTEQVDLTTSTAVSGFAEGSGPGNYTQSLWVGCTENGKSPIIVTMVLEDEYGQRSAERQTSVAVSYGNCPAGAGTAGPTGDGGGFVVGADQGAQ